MAGIFINYRSDDAVFAPSLIDERIRRVFGTDNVFLDCRDLHAGTRLEPAVWRSLLSSTVLLALIGPDWLTLTDEAGQRRIDSPDDFVRREIRAALQGGLYVIPVLLQTTVLPPAESLPDDINELSKRQYVHLRVRQAQIDLDHLVDEIRRLVPPAALPTLVPPAALPTVESRTSIGNVITAPVNAGFIAGRDVHNHGNGA